MAILKSIRNTCYVATASFPLSFSNLCRNSSLCLFWFWIWILTKFSENSAVNQSEALIAKTGIAAAFGIVRCWLTDWANLTFEMITQEEYSQKSSASVLAHQKGFQHSLNYLLIYIKYTTKFRRLKANSPFHELLA